MQPYLIVFVCFCVCACVRVCVFCFVRQALRPVCCAITQSSLTPLVRMTRYPSPHRLSGVYLIGVLLMQLTKTVYSERYICLCVIEWKKTTNHRLLMYANHLYILQVTNATIRLVTRMRERERKNRYVINMGQPMVVENLVTNMA